ncbi:MAG: hypothetical protein FJX74_12815, partial [Armatimonadetes bacterium]|nr:hypothetical protein [Armatimonadota bacterium]
MTREAPFHTRVEVSRAAQTNGKGMIAAAAQEAFVTMVGIVAVLFILAWPAYRIVSMWLMRELTTAEAVGALAVLLGFLAGIITTWGQLLSGLLLLLL